MGIPNYKFDEVLAIFEETLYTLKAQAPTVDAYNNLLKLLILSFQKVFEKIGEVKETLTLALKVGPSNAKGGEVVVPTGNKARISNFEIKLVTKRR